TLARCGLIIMLPEQATATILFFACRRYGDEEIQYLRRGIEQYRLRTVAQAGADDRWRSQVTAVDRDRRHAVDLVVVLQLCCLAHLGLHAEGIVGVVEFLHVHALLGDEVSDLLVGIQMLALGVDRTEDFRMQRL